MSIFFGILPPLPTITRFTFAGDVQNVERGMVPRVYGRSYAIEADLEVPGAGAEGVIVANADFIGGFALWVDGQGMLHHTYSFPGVETYRQTSTEKIPAGAVTVKMLFDADKRQPGTGGTVTLWANGKLIGEGEMPHTVPVAFSSYAGMDIGRDNGLVVDLAYEDKAPYAFTGTVKKVVFDLKPATHEDEQACTSMRRYKPSATAPPAESRKAHPVSAMTDKAGTLLPGSAPRVFHLLAKPTRAVCNLDCTYCFFLSKELLYPAPDHQ